MEELPDREPRPDGGPFPESPSAGAILARCRFTVDPVRFLVRRANYADARPLTSPDWRCWYVEAGRGEVRVGTKRLVVRPRDLLIIRPGDRVQGRTGTSAPSRHYVANWSPLDAHFFQALDFPPLCRMEDDWSGELFSRAHAAEVARARGAAGDRTLGRLVFLLGLFQGLEARHLIRVRRDYGKAEGYRRLLGLLEHLQGNLNRKFSLAELGEFAGSDRTTVIRWFRKYLKTTPADWFRRERLERSRHLLHQGLTIHEVSRRCGFPDPFTFSKAFKACFLRSPTEFLKESARDLHALTFIDGRPVDSREPPAKWKAEDFHPKM
ncbi:MAG: helix-turn-helix transcriptional regulator [Spirochaetes bacterium]|nr:helix-turn-helix transcriptional regulator [Spirochaetota bacterium]